MTLMELLIVLAIVAVLIGVAAPAMRRPLAKSELGRAAVTVREAIADARLAAIKRGCVQYFSYEVETSHYASGPHTNIGANEQQTLPDGLTFAGAQRAEDATTPMEFPASPTDAINTESTQGTREPAAFTEEPNAVRSAPAWSSPTTIAFLPDGRTSSTSVTLASTEHTITLHLRGLTGHVTLGPITRRTSNNEMPAMDAPGVTPDHATDVAPDVRASNPVPWPTRNDTVTP